MVRRQSSPLQIVSRGRKNALCGPLQAAALGSRGIGQSRQRPRFRHTVLCQDRRPPARSPARFRTAWGSARSAGDSVLGCRFRKQCRATLPGRSGPCASLWGGRESHLSQGGAPWKFARIGGPATAPPRVRLAENTPPCRLAENSTFRPNAVPKCFTDKSLAACRKGLTSLAVYVYIQFRDLVSA